MRFSRTAAYMAFPLSNTVYGAPWSCVVGSTQLHNHPCWFSILEVPSASVGCSIMDILPLSRTLWSLTLGLGPFNAFPSPEVPTSLLFPSCGFPQIPPYFDLQSWV